LTRYKSRSPYSRIAREKSKQLLEIAKTGVERAIEEDEESAIARSAIAYDKTNDRCYSNGLN
jgi:hypothetical protein